ncbi:carbon-nitrogen hydrolase family protein [Okibacterium endophyticum]
MTTTALGADQNGVHAPTGVAIAQFVPRADTEANLESIRALTVRASERGATIVVFPEYSNFYAEPMGPPFVARAEDLDGVFVRTIGALATELDVHIVIGMAERVSADETRFSNTVVAVAPGGDVVAQYRKQHLYDAFGQKESDWVVPGDTGRPQTFSSGGLRFGLQTCYDIRFPEVSRRIVDAGANVLLVPAQWVRGPLKEHHWRTLVTARAIENTAYVVAADHAPPTGIGNSLVVDPAGVGVASVGTESDVAVAFLSPERLLEVRRSNPALSLRRYAVAPLPD